MKKVLLFLIIIVTILAESCNVEKHYPKGSQCRPEFMVGYGDTK